MLQVNRTGIFLIAVFLIGGIILFVVDRLAGDPFAVGQLTGGIWIVVALILLAVAIRQRFQARHDDRVVGGGLKGTAKILSAELTGRKVNDQPQARVEFELRVPGTETRRVSKTMLIPSYAAAHVASKEGLELPAHVDPKDHSRVVIAW